MMLFGNGHRIDHKGQFGVAAILPVEGVTPDGKMTVLHNVPEAALAYLVKKGIPFERSN